MSQAHRKSQGFHPIRAAARRRPAEGRRAHAGPVEPVHGRPQHCTAYVPARGLAGALRRGYTATPAARAVGRLAPDFCAGSTGVDVPSDRPPASLGDLEVGLGAEAGDCV